MADDPIVVQQVHSHKPGVANYYEWNSGTYDECGYFVSMVPHTITIKVCDGSTIFGVTISEAGFIGNDGEVRDNHYALVATSGTVKVRCELDVQAGDYVVSNSYGVATKTLTGSGYFVTALTEEYGIAYAVITLGVQACTTNLLHREVVRLNEKIDTAETNIVAAVNVANQAYNKAVEANDMNQNVSNKVDNALGVVDEIASDVEDLGTQVSDAVVISTQAKAIAESAATFAEGAKKEAVESANNTMAQIAEFTKSLEPLTTWIDPQTGNKGASYLVNHINNGLATKTEIETVEEDLEYATSAIAKNAKSIQALVTSIDKYAVGPYSQAYGFTLEQATSILEEGMIYVPTQDKTGDNKEVYGPTSSREFLRGYLYRWGKSGDVYGWITIDKNYSVDKLNTSAPSVYFSPTEPAVSGTFGYWYTDGDTVADGYNPYTLYKWEPYADGDTYHWMAVATLAGNSQNRAVSQIRQDANSVSAEVVDARGDFASLSLKLNDTNATVRTVANWQTGAEDRLAIVEQKADDNGASVGLIVTDGKVNGFAVIEAINGETGATIEADRINLNGYVTVTDLSSKDKTEIHGSNITTGTIDADKINVEDLNAFNATIAGWEITEDNLCTRTSTDDANHYEVGMRKISSGLPDSEDIPRIIAVGYYEEPSELSDGYNLGDYVISTDGIDAHLCQIYNDESDDAFRWLDLDEDLILYADITFTEGGVTIQKGEYFYWDTVEYMPVVVRPVDLSQKIIYAKNTNKGVDSHPFYVTADGKVHMETGDIAGNTIDEKGLSITNGTIDIMFGESGDRRRFIAGEDFADDGFISAKAGIFNEDKSVGLYLMLNMIAFTANGQSVAKIYFDPKTLDGTLNGTWYGTVSQGTASDRNVKHDIEHLTDAYAMVFDNLKPVRFKYDDGESDRYHTGFIAQDVEDAVIASGMTTKDLAAVCYQIDEDGNKVNYSVRYDEIVALNTHEIQKLKARNAELENRLAELEEKLNKLIAE